MRKTIVTFACLFLLTACIQTNQPNNNPSPTGDALITKEYIDENIYNFYLDLSNLGLTKIPDFSEIATAVQKEDIIYLNLGKNNITEISDDLLALPNLKEVKLDNNQIKKLENIHGISMLKTLELFKNQIEEIELENLPTLTNLDLSHNKLEADDLTAIAKINSLETLQLQHNQIDSIENLKTLENLTSLKIESNQLKDVSVLNQMQNLKSITLGNNPLPADVIEKWTTFHKENKAKKETEEKT